MNDVDGFIQKHSEELKGFLNFCSSTYNLSGGAVASNQVSMNGKRLMYRVFALNGIVSLFENKLDNDLGWQLIINPIIDEYIGVETEKTEGCLSWDGKKIIMKRSPKIKVSYYTMDGNKVEGRVFEGLVAQVWQHETDHLNGVKMKVEESTLIESMIYKEGGSIPIKK
jgi:peptide deformylase